MPGLFDVSKETILVTGASQGLWAAVPRARAVCPWCGRGAGGAADRQAEGAGTRDQGERRPGCCGRDGRHRPCLDRRRHRCGGSRAWPDHRADQQCRDRDRETGGRTDRSGLGRRDRRQPQGRLFHRDRNGAADDRAQAGRQHRQRRFRRSASA